MNIFKNMKADKSGLRITDIRKALTPFICI
jgi:hypothetical protein